MPPAPVRFSTMIDCPRRAASGVCSLRARISAVPPGAKPTTIRTGRLGHGSCPQIGVASGTSAAPRPFKTDRLCIVTPLSLRCPINVANNRRNGVRERDCEQSLRGVVIVLTMPKVHRTHDRVLVNDRRRNDGAASSFLDSGTVRKRRAQCGEILSDKYRATIEDRLAPAAADMLLHAADRIALLAAVEANRSKGYRIEFEDSEYLECDHLYQTFV